MKVQFLGKKLVAQNMYTFTFSPKKRVHYFPGQYMYYTLPGIAHNDGRGPSREMTLSSSPTEVDIAFTTSIASHSAFKKTLIDLVPGTFIEADGPHGVFYFTDDDMASDHLFIAGGLGITPFRSMNKYIKDKKLKIKRHLLHFVNTRDRAVFLDEFKNKKLVVTGKKPSKLLLKKHIVNSLKNLKDPNIWIAGPDDFVTAVESILYTLQFPQDKIHFEKLTGVK